MDIQAKKHDNVLKKVFKNFDLIFEDENFHVFGSKSPLVFENKKETLLHNDIVFWFFSKNKNYNIIWFFNDKKRKFFINIASFLEKENKEYFYVDFDIDFSIDNYGNYSILDLKDFNRNRIKFNYGADLINSIWKTVDELRDLIENNKDFFSDNYCDKFLDREEVKKWINQK